MTLPSVSLQVETFSLDIQISVGINISLQQTDTYLFNTRVISSYSYLRSKVTKFRFEEARSQENITAGKFFDKTFNGGIKIGS